MIVVVDGSSCVTVCARPRRSFEHFSRAVPVCGPTARAGYDDTFLRRGLGLFWLGVLDLGIDGAAVDGASALLALNNPRRRQRHLIRHKTIVGEYPANIILRSTADRVRQIRPSILLK